MLRTTLLLGVLILTAAPIVLAQDAGGVIISSPALGSVEPGARVRLRVPTRSSKAVVGFVDALRHDTLFLAGSSLGQLDQIPLAAIERLEVNLKRGSGSKGVGIGAGVGALAGGAVGFAVGSASEEDCSGQVLCFEGLQTMSSTFAGALIGGLLGAAVSAAGSGDKWVDVPVGELRVSPQAVGLSLHLQVGR